MVTITQILQALENTPQNHNKKEKKRKEQTYLLGGRGKHETNCHKVVEAPQSHY